jgi:membrane associated rhomboid family serine protease
MIFPIRTETDTKKLPYFTMGLIILNLLIWVFTSRIVGPEDQARAEIRYAMFKIEYKYSEIMQQDPSFAEKIGESPDRYFKNMMEPTDYELWNALYTQYMDSFKSSFFYRWGFKPNRIEPVTMMTSIFLHANLMHVFFNMLFLWIVGCNIEDEWGWKTFIIFYLVCGLCATLMHLAMNLGSDSPCIGASGAVSGVMGAFMVRHYKTKIRFAYYFLPFRPFFGTFAVMACIWLPVWLVEQIVGAKWSSMSGTAYWAHIGGFAFGAVVGLTSKGFDSVKIPLPSMDLGKTALSPEKLLDLRKTVLDGQSGTVLGFLPQIRHTLSSDPGNVTARLILAKLYCEKGRLREAALMYNAALGLLIKKNAPEGIPSLIQEVRENQLLGSLSEAVLLRLAMVFEQKSDFMEAVRMYNCFINSYPSSSYRPKVLHRAAMILRTRLNNETAAERALSHLKNEYPAYTQALQSVGSEA